MKCKKRRLSFAWKQSTKRWKSISIVQACIDVEYYSIFFREAKTIVLKKVEKSDYTFFKVYRSIALLNTMSKMLKSIMTNKITELTKKNILLLKLQISAKRKKNRNDAENTNERNRRNMKAKQRQDDHDHESERIENIWLRIICQTITQFYEKKRY